MPTTLKSLIVKTLTANTGGLAAGFVTSVLLSRCLGPTGRGELTAAMLWPGLLGYIGGMGLIPAILYFSGLPEADTSLILGTSLAFAVLQGLVLIPIGFSALPWLIGHQSATVVDASRLYLLLIPLFAANQYSSSILQARMQLQLTNKLRLILPLGYLLGTVVLILLGRLGLVSIIILHLGLNCVTLVATLAVLLRSGAHLRIGSDTALARKLLRYGGRAQIGDISQLANLRLDQTLLAAWLPPAQLGLYAVAVNATGIGQVLSVAVRTVLTPSVTRQPSTPDRVMLIRRVFQSYWVASLLLTVSAGSMIPVAIPVLFGSQFVRSVPSAEVLVLGMLFLGACIVLAGGTQALGDPWLSSRAEMGALAVTLLLLLILVPTFGIMGAAVASLAAYTTQLAILLRGLNRSYGLTPKELLRVNASDITLLFTTLPRTSNGRTTDIR